MFSHKSIDRADHAKLPLRGLIHTGNGVQAAGIADIRQALGDHTDQESLVIAQIHVALGMGGELGLATALRRQKAEGDHFPLSERQPGAGIVVAEAVGCKPAVDMAGFPSSWCTVPLRGVLRRGTTGPHW